MSKQSLSMYKGLWLLLGMCALLLCLLGFTYTSRQQYVINSKTTQARVAVVRVLGITSLALSDECLATRNPIEGLCGSMSDIPGAYLYHMDCDLVEPSLFPPETRYLIEVRRK